MKSFKFLKFWNAAKVILVLPLCMYFGIIESVLFPDYQAITNHELLHDLFLGAFGFLVVFLLFSGLVKFRHYAIATAAGEETLHFFVDWRPIPLISGIFRGLFSDRPTNYGGYDNIGRILNYRDSLVSGMSNQDGVRLIGDTAPIVDNIRMNRNSRQMAFLESKLSGMSSRDGLDYIRNKYK